MSILDEIDQLFKENPSLTEKQVIEKLKQMKQWKMNTIRSKVSSYMSMMKENKNEKTQTTTQLEQMKTKSDPFKISDNEKIKVGELKMNEEIKNMFNELRNDFTDLIKDFKSIVSSEIDKIKHDIHCMKQRFLETVPLAETIKYKDMPLMETTIDAVSKEIQSDDTLRIADYIDEAVSKFKVSFKLYNTVTDTLGKPGSKEKIMLFYDEDGDIAYDNMKKARFALDKKSLLIGILIGATAASLIVFAICWFLFNNTTPPPL